MPRYIEKIRIPVQIARAACEPLAGWLSLAPRAEFRDGPETLLELLNGSNRVLPLVLPEGDTCLLLRDAIEWVTVGPDAPGGLVAPAGFAVTCEERVQVRLQGGGHLDGILRMELPEHLNRASDFLNGAGDFFPLASGVRTLIVNKGAVSEVRLFKASPKPLDSNERAA
jgi:hypothetical protein